MAETDEQIIKKALGSGLGYLMASGSKSDEDRKKFADARLALDRLMAHTLPELPEGFYLQVVQRMYNVLGSEHGWRVCVYGADRIEIGEGATIHAACEAAIAKIGGAG